MKRKHQIITLALVGALALGVAVSSVSAETVTLWQAKGNGRSAEVQFSDYGNGIRAGGRINLFQNNGQTFLFYEIWGNDPSSEVCHTEIGNDGTEFTICVFTRTTYNYGWGLIPTNDIEFTATSAHLATTTGPGFSTTHCVTVVSNSVTTCSAGASVAFNLLWTANDLSTKSSAGVTETAIGPFKFTSQGAVQGTSAFVSGSALGIGVANAPGWLGDTKIIKNIATQTTP